MKTASILLRCLSAQAALCAATLVAQQQPATSTQQPAPAAQQPAVQAQQPAAPAESLPNAPEQVPQVEGKPLKESEEDFNKEEHQRLLGVLPTFNVVLGGAAPPLTPRQKYSLFFRTVTEPALFVVTGLDAGIEQAEDQFPAYHYGFTGYLKRYAASYADSFDGNLFGNAILPSLLHQDPRYFRLGHGTFSHRLGYALASTVRSKGDNGHWQFATSNIAGNLIGGAISNAYYPQENRGLGLTFQRGFIVTAEGSIGGLLDEFYPDAIAYLKRHHHK